MDKDLAPFKAIFGFEFTNAPEELKQKAIAHRESFLRKQKARAQLDLWIEEKDNSEDRFQSTLKDFNEVLGRWDPDANTIKVKEELVGAPVEK